jgi:hypothetical protein
MNDSIDNPALRSEATAYRERIHSLYWAYVAFEDESAVFHGTSALPKRDTGLGIEVNADGDGCISHIALGKQYFHDQADVVKAIWGLGSIQENYTRGMIMAVLERDPDIWVSASLGFDNTVFAELYYGHLIRRRGPNDNIPLKTASRMVALHWFANFLHDPTPLRDVEPA